jgi:hypothetical protein
MLENIFWNLVFIFDLGGIVSLGLYIFARWPSLIKKLDTLLGLAGIFIVLFLIAAAIFNWCFFPRRGVIIHGIHYQDWWKDD